MSGAEIVSLRPADDGLPFAACHARLAGFLQRYALVESLAAFRAHGLSFPFVGRDTVLPHRRPPGPELAYQNTALLVCIDGMLPPALVKHFRLRPSNQTTWGNIRRIAPTVDLAGYKAVHNRIDAPECLGLLRQLLPLDYALLVTRPSAGAPLHLSHMHVKVERLTDNAIRDLGRKLGYVRRSLMERGEDFAEALEAKFFEYYGFRAPASGRKTAAAMAAQLLAGHVERYSVFIAGQQDNRLTVLPEGPLVQQYMLVVADATQPMFHPDGTRLSEATLGDYGLPGWDPPVLLFEATFRRTAAALPSQTYPREAEVLEPWLALVGERLMPPEGSRLAPLQVRWAVP